jgi:integration host factor subunit beta
MTKGQLIDNLSIREDLQLTKREAETAVNAVFDAMTAALVNGDRIEIRGLGSFKVKDRMPRIGRNPKTGDVVPIPACRVPSFVAGKSMKVRSC